MGYRNYITIVDREELKKLNDIPECDICDNFGDSGASLYMHVTHALPKELYELGRCVDLSFLEKHRVRGAIPRWLYASLNDDSDFFEISKDGLLAIIDDFRQKVVAYYENVIKEEECLTEIVDKVYLWGKCVDQFKVTPYDLTDKESIVSSWLYEYGIFELVRLYKTIDYDKYAIIITGW